MFLYFAKSSFFPIRALFQKYLGASPSDDENQAGQRE